MKTIFTYILFTLFSCVFVFGQVIEEKEKELFKKYKVKECTRFDYKYIEGKPASNGVKTSLSVYNNEGLVLERLYYNAKGEEITQENFGYDKRSNRVLYERKSLSGVYKKSSKYDDEDKVVMESGYDGSTAFKTVYKYSSQNKLIEIIYYADNLLDEKRVYKYSGNKATVEILQKGKNLKSTIYLLYNNANKIIEERIVSLTGVELEKRNIIYNTKGLIAKEEKFRSGKFAYRVTYHYDSNGELVRISEESTSKGKYDKKLYSYDNSGRVLEYKWTKKPNQDYNIKKYTYGAAGICSEEYTHYPKTNYKLLSKFKYNFY